MKTILTKILLRFQVGTIVRFILTIKKFPVFSNLAGNLSKHIFLNYNNKIKYTNLDPDIVINKWAIQAWFEIHNGDIGIDFLYKTL